MLRIVGLPFPLEAPLNAKRHTNFFLLVLLSERCGLIKSQSKLCLKFLSLKKMNSSLNRAHWLHRQAEKATRKGRVEEAVQCK